MKSRKRKPCRAGREPGSPPGGCLRSCCPSCLPGCPGGYLPDAGQSCLPRRAPRPMGDCGPRYPRRSSPNRPASSLADSPAGCVPNSLPSCLPDSPGGHLPGHPRDDPYPGMREDMNRHNIIICQDLGIACENHSTPLSCNGLSTAICRPLWTPGSRFGERRSALGVLPSS